MSVELRYDPDTEEMRCDYGLIENTWVSSDAPGVVQNMGPLILVLADTAKVTSNLALFGVEFTVDGSVARTTAVNGHWVHLLEPAHWRGGIRPSDSDDLVMLGRWPD